MRTKATAGIGIIVVATLTLVAALTGHAGAAGASASDASGIASDWYGALNQYRAASGVEPVAHNSTWSSWAYNHGRYSICSGQLTHYEVAHPAYTSEGDYAARHSNLAAGGTGRSGRSWVEQWMSAPFHAINMLDPRLASAGFAVAETGPGDVCYGVARWNAAAVLDVLSGRDYSRPLRTITFPGNGSRVPLQQFHGETPDPRINCPGGPDAWNGLPLIAMFGAPVNSAQAYLAGPAGNLAVCVVSAATYWHPDPAWSDTARSILANSNAVIAIPQAPLAPGGHHFVAVRDGVEAADSWFEVLPEGS
ncbi:MAG: CAP domain-containing protein [Acidimicrobiia bacterium]|nr:CAP domain-containing protein [Acidimicrobiia bacterium]